MMMTMRRRMEKKGEKKRMMMRKKMMKVKRRRRRRGGEGRGGEEEEEEEKEGYRKRGEGIEENDNEENVLGTLECSWNIGTKYDEEETDGQGVDDNYERRIIMNTILNCLNFLCVHIYIYIYI